MANLLEDINKALDGEEIDLIVFGKEDWDYSSWTRTDTERWEGLVYNKPYHNPEVYTRFLDVKYNNEFGSEDHPPIWASTKSGKYILISVCYDGATSIHRVPTGYQFEYQPQFFGGG